MFGRNQLARQNYQVRPDQPVALAVNEIFYTIQGEGPYAGRPSVFIRLSGCNLRCHFCDTEFESSVTMPVEWIVAKVNAMGRHLPRNPLVVITGGEPLRQQIIPLLLELCDREYYVQIETAGTVVPDPFNHPVRGLVHFEQICNPIFASLVCSPKTGKVHPVIERLCSDWKYIIRAGETNPDDGLPEYSTQSEGLIHKLFRPSAYKTGTRNVQIWVQPCTEYHDKEEEPTERNVDTQKTKENAKLCATIAMQYGYRLSLQVHKIIGLP